MNRRKIVVTFGMLSLIVLVAGDALATSTDMSRMRTKYPSLPSRLNVCTTCHTSVPARNSYGAAWMSAGGAGTSTASAAAFTTIEPFDSDGDGFTNIAEITAGTFPGNASDKPVSVTSTPTPTRTFTFTPTDTPLLETPTLTPTDTPITETPTDTPIDTPTDTPITETPTFTPTNTPTLSYDLNDDGDVDGADAVLLLTGDRGHGEDLFGFSLYWFRRP